MVRLVGGNAISEGRVEVFHHNYSSHRGQWGTVCDSHWFFSNAQVVCRQLGLPHSATAVLRDALYGAGSGPIWLDKVRCDGSETLLVDCIIEG